MTDNKLFPDYSDAELLGEWAAMHSGRAFDRVSIGIAYVMKIEGALRERGLSAEIKPASAVSVAMVNIAASAMALIRPASGDYSRDFDLYRDILSAAADGRVVRKDVKELWFAKKDAEALERARQDVQRAA